MKTLHLKTSIDRSPLRLGFLVIPLMLACFAVSQAVLPPPDGGYPNRNTAEGTNALFSLAGGNGNTAIGNRALHDVVSGDFNTGVGAFALEQTIGPAAHNNVAVGIEAMRFNTQGQNNVAVGGEALLRNHFGNGNTAIGQAALLENIDANFNTGVGEGALAGNTDGTLNTAVGAEAGNSGDFNTVVGALALQASQSNAHDNVAVGINAMNMNTNGQNNTAVGSTALFRNLIGNGNTAVGISALQSTGESGGFTANFNTGIGEGAGAANTDGRANTAIGAEANTGTTGNTNIALGFQAGQLLTTGDNNIDIGNVGKAADANTIRIGTVGTQTLAFIAGIFGTGVSGVPVMINSNGRLGTLPSSARFKEEIKPIDKASEAILALKPVSFRYKKEIDAKGIPQFGLVAEQVEKVNPDLVARDEQGKAYTVRYEAVNAMLLNEFLKEHSKVEKLEKGMAVLTAQLKEQAAQIQKVSAQLEVSKPAPQVVNNP